MNFRKLIYIAALILAVVSCSKDEETEATPGLNGTLSIVGLPEFMSPGATFTLHPKGAVHPDGKELNYSWKVSPSMSKYDTTEVFTHTFSDTLQTYTVYCNAYASGYSGLSANIKTTVVAPGYNGSIKGIDYKSIADDSVYVRHMPYYYKSIGTQTWTLNNMAVRSGVPFRNAEVMSEVFGRYYNFDQAKAACDSLDTANGNWELPTREEWQILSEHISSEFSNTYGKTLSAAMMADASFNGVTFWEYWPQIGDIKNGSGFSAISTGYANIQANRFKGEFEYAIFWTSDQVSETEAYYTYLICDQPGMFTSVGNKASFGASVRCIRK